MKIEIKNFNKKIQKQFVLSDINLCTNNNNILAIIGPNGSGKSTLIKCLLGLVIPDDGSKLYLEEKLVDEENKINAGYMSQIPEFPANLSVKEILTFIEKLDGKETIYKEELIKDLGIYKFINKKYRNLSQGMKQKLNILQCFMFDKELYIVDEATASLSPDIAYYLKNLFLQKKREKKTIIFATHIISEVEALADELAILYEGKLLTINSKEKLINLAGSKNLEDAILKYWK